MLLSFCNYRIAADVNQITINDIQTTDEGLYACQYIYETVEDTQTEVGVAGCVTIYGE